MTRARDWARRNLPPEGVALDGGREHLAACILHPHYLRWWAQATFRRHTAWPGDRWFNLTHDKAGIVRRVRRDGVVLAVASGQMVAWTGAGWDFESVAAPALEFVPWENWRWQPL